VSLCIRFEVSTAVTMKNAVFWDVAPCRYCVKHLLTLPPRSRIFYTLKMEATLPSEMSVRTRSTRHHIPEDDMFHCHYVVC
jgi:hypothetical protein